MSPPDLRLRSPSAARNRGPIADVMAGAFPPNARVLELASGSGEHAVFVSKLLQGAVWQPSDPDADARASIAAWIESEARGNVRAPLNIDARESSWGVESETFDVLVAINVIHISPWETTLGLMAGAARLLRTGGLVFLYGPYKRDGAHTAPSNEAFDVSLRSRDPSWGVRDLGDVEKAANAHGLALERVVEMPANNLSVLFRRL